jgi:hypothetical protein
MELTSGVLSRDEYMRAIIDVIELMASEGVKNVLVAYGFGCDCPDEQLYEDQLISLDRLEQFITEAEQFDYYRVGKDNFHVKDGTGRIEFLFCHEADIHFISEDKGLVERLKAKWLADGFCGMFAHLGTEWQAIPMKRQAGEAEPGAAPGQPRE